MRNNIPFGSLIALTCLLLFIGIVLTISGVNARQDYGLFTTTGDPEQTIIGLSLIGLGVVGLIGTLTAAATIVAAGRRDQPAAAAQN